MSRYVIAETYLAGGTVNTASIVKIDTANDRKVLQAGVGDRLLGICQIGANALPTSSTTPVAASSGDPVQVYAPGSTVPVTYGGTVVRGDDLTSDASGNAVTAIAGNYIIAKAIESGAANDVREVLVLPPDIVMAAGATPPTGVTGTVTGVVGDSGKTLLATAADVTYVLPPLATSKGFRIRVVSWAAAATLQGGSIGTLLTLNAADSAQKMFGTVITSPAANKGIVNTKTTAIQGDNVVVFNPDGLNWLAESTSGTWVRQA